MLLQQLCFAVLGDMQAEEAVTAKNFPKGVGQARSQQDSVGGLQSGAAGPVVFGVWREVQLGRGNMAVDSVAPARFCEDAVSRDVKAEP